MLGAAGIPESLAATRDYDAIFARLMAHGITLFFPTFQTIEAPEPAGLGFEADFVDCNGAGFAAARRTGMKILLPSNIIYPGRLPPLRRDPLKNLIACWSDVIAGITSYDEPVHIGGATLGECKALYARVKKIAPGLPVVMVHAPRITDVDRDWTRYFADVKAYSAWSDLAGFDCYPVTPEMMKVGTPDGTVPDDAAVTVASYVQWLADNLTLKARIMVLQGFPQTAVYDDAWLAANATPEQIAAARAPTAAEIGAMFAAADPHCLVTMWWGQSMLVREDMAPWPAVLDVAGNMAG